MLVYVARAVVQKINHSNYPANTIGTHSSQIMDMSACKSCWKSFKDRNSIKSSLSLIKVRLKCNYLNYVYFQFVKFSNKTSIAATAVKICFPFTIINKFKIYPLLSDKNYYNSDQMNHACL